MTLPNFLGIGAQRSGTSWLTLQLKSHPKIYMSDRKEVHFFDRYYDRGLDWYQRFFPKDKQAAKYRWIGEITPNYMYMPEVPALIHTHLPDCKFIAILRNPADRVYSQYNMSILKKADKRTFKEYLEQKSDTFTRSLYCQQIKRYLQYFPLENFLILIFEETMKKPEQALNKIAEFLSIDVSGFQKNDINQKINYSARVRFARSYALALSCVDWLRKKELDWVFDITRAVGLRKELFAPSSIPEIDPSVRRELLLKYEADISDLEKLLGIDFSIWRTQ